MVDCRDVGLEPHYVGLDSSSAKFSPTLGLDLSGPWMNSVSQMRGYYVIFFILWVSGYALIRRKGYEYQEAAFKLTDEMLS